MKHDRVTIAIVPDIRRVKGGEHYPLKLRITYKGVRKYYGTGYDVSMNDWDVINSPDAKAGLRKIKNALATIEIDAQKCCNEIIPFSFEKFEYEFFNKKIAYENIKAAFDTYIIQLKQNEQHGTAKAYQDSINSLSKFKPNLKFVDITKEFLDNFEKWMVDRNKSLTTVGIYLRPLRAIMNLAKENGTIKPEAYPFGKRRYVIPTGRNIKKALNINEIKQIFNYPAEPGSGLEKAKDFWTFSYLCNGINMADIARLRWKSINPETIVFEREKTKRTRREAPVKIIALRNRHINAILEKWGSKEIRNSNTLVFDIINELDNGDKARKKVLQFIHVTNDWMKPLGQKLGFNVKLTTYVARHSFATILVRNGAPLELANQTLGHSSILTTQKYFAGFDLSAQAEYTKALTDF